MAEVKPEIETFAKIKVVGVGGGGNSAINRMIDSGVKGVGFVAVNTDIQALHHNKAGEKIHIGKTVTRGLGAGMNPELGKAAAEESENEIKEVLKELDADKCYESSCGKKNYCKIISINNVFVIGNIVNLSPNH